MMNDLVFTKQEFLTDSAKYFLDKKTLYLEIKEYIGAELSLPLSMIKVCGSAYWGKSYATNLDFQPGQSDLDIALIDQMLFVRSLSETRQMTRNFSNLTFFPGSPVNAPNTFQDYAYKKGIIRIDLMPRTKLKIRMNAVSAGASRLFQEHFSKVSFAIYDNEDSFSVKQITPMKKFKGAAR